MIKRPKQELRRLEQIVISGSIGRFVADVNALLLDGWYVVPGTYSYSTVRQAADDRTPPERIDSEGTTYRINVFVALWREELVNPDAVREAIGAADGMEPKELET